MLDQANFSMIQSHSRMEQVPKNMETLLSTLTGSIGDQQDQNFSQDDNVVPKKRWNGERITVTQSYNQKFTNKRFIQKV